MDQGNSSKSSRQLSTMREISEINLVIDLETVAGLLPWSVNSTTILSMYSK